MNLASPSSFLPRPLGLGRMIWDRIISWDWVGGNYSVRNDSVCALREPPPVLAVVRRRVNPRFEPSDLDLSVI